MKIRGQLNEFGAPMGDGTMGGGARNPGKKFTKAEVKFESPGMGKEKCSDCVHFRPFLQPVRACDIVAGVIYPRDWCREWQERKGTK